MADPFLNHEMVEVVFKKPFGLGHRRTAAGERFFLTRDGARISEELSLNNFKHKFRVTVSIAVDRGLDRQADEMISEQRRGQ